MRLLLILLILPYTVFSQTDIEHIRNDSDVVNFIRASGHQFFPYYKDNRLSTVTFNMQGRSWMYREKFDEEDGQFTDSVMSKRWFVEDFDNDGIKDLVFYGRIESEGGVFVFFGGKDYRLKILTDLFARHNPHSIELYKIGKTNSIIIGTLEQPTDFRAKQKPFAERFFHDTLVYEFGGFIEYNDKIKHGPAFDSIHFRPLSNWIGSNTWYINIYKNDSAVYVRNRDTIIEKLVGNMNVTEWQHLIDYIGFAQLKDTFILKNVSDQTVGLTTIYFANGKKKTVYDYGMTGTYGLETFYNRMYSWINAVKWRVVALRNGYLGYKGEF